MSSLRQTLKPWIRAVGNRLRFPGARIGTSTYLSGGCEVARSVSTGRDCKVFAAHLGHETHLGDNVVIGHHARLVDSLLGRNCLVEADARISSSYLAEYVSIQTQCSLTHTQLGRYSYVARGAYLNDVSIGNFASIGPGVLLGCGEHPVDLPSTSPLFYSTRGQCGASFATTDGFAERRPIQIGHDVWLGARVFVRDGITIGHGAIVAAGAVVSADVPPYAIVGGVPAKLIRYRFPAATIQALLALEWWSWSDERLRQTQPWFARPDIGAFLQEATA